MIIVKSEREIELMRRAGKITAAARALAGEMVKPGVTTREIDKAVFHFIRSQGAEPSFLNYNGYPASVCVSVNDEIIHGIPGPRVLKEGDIVSVDVGAYIGGFHGDCAATYPCGKISEEAQRLIDVTRQSFFEGFAQAREGNRISDISHAVQAYVEANGFSVVREYVGHGVGRNMHEAPEIPNYGAPGHGPKLLRGMTIAVEPMVNAGTAAIRQMSDGWTVKTRDGKYAAHATGLNVQFQTFNDKLNTLRQLGLNLLTAVAQVAQHFGTVDSGAMGSIDTVERRRRKVGWHFDSGYIDVRFFHYPRRSIMVAAIAGRFIVYRCRPSAPCSLRSQSWRAA